MSSPQPTHEEAAAILAIIACTNTMSDIGTAPSTAAVYEGGPPLPKNHKCYKSKPLCIYIINSDDVNRDKLASRLEFIYGQKISWTWRLGKYWIHDVPRVLTSADTAVLQAK